MKRLEVKKLDFAYGRNQILFEFDFSLEESQIGCLLGPSGCGKTTALRAIAGFENPTKGEIILNGNKLNSSKIFVEPEKRQMGMVFQDIALFPHLSVKENIQFGIRSLSQNLRDKRSNELLDLVGRSEFKKKYPHEISGGQQQRVAIARSLCKEPSIMLFDEPTSALDPEMINEVLDVMTELATSGITMICVTHETGIARRVADKMVFMDLGEIVEMAEPEKFFSAPESPRCRDFLDKILHH